MNKSTLSRLLIVSAMVPFSLLPMRSNADDSVWRDVTVATALSRAGGEPIYYRPLQADAALLKSLLTAAPREFTSSQGTVLSLPMPDGTMQRFEVLESPIMEPGLAQRYPGIRTYYAVGIDDPTATGRLDITQSGFHAMIRGASGSVFIDPEQSNSYYRSYYKRDYASLVGRSATSRFVCLVKDAQSGARNTAMRATVLSRTGDTLRTYRLAVAATGEYTAKFGGTKAGALSAIVTAINRVNEIYERDLAIHLVLIANDDSVIYTDAATDPYDNNSASAILAASQPDFDAVIGSSNYDIGHVFSTGSGGLAALGVVCGTSKARATTGLADPTGDPFYIDYVAHEMGHQFNANHTFNGTTFSCGGSNRNASTAYEPGSGSTVMAYAGICGSENLQSNSDATFHAGSIAEIESFVTSGAGAACASTSPTGNSPPTVNAGGDYTIPRLTPFAVDAGAGTTDPDGDTLTYQWDEMDVGTATDSATFGSDLGDNPLFRSFLPKSVSGRHFPRFGYLLTGTSSIGETLPNTSRTLNFRLTVRDGRDGVDKSDMKVIVDGGSGPFKVLSPNGGESLTALSGAVDVTWNVAGTSAAPVSCANVDIELLTFNSGHTSYCSHTLAASTPNDGSQSGLAVGVANNGHARIRIRCSNNIFYDVSDADITVSGAATSEPTNCTSIDEVPPVGSGGNTGGGGGGGFFGPWLLGLLGVVFGLRYWFSARRSV